MNFGPWLGWSFVALALAGCDKPKRYTTTVELIQVHRLGQDPKNPATMMDLEMRFAECPGDARKVIRTNKAFGACGAKFKNGDKITAELVQTYSYERGNYRAEIVKLDDCDVQVDPKEDANYEMVQDCKDVMSSGAVVGVHCDRTRNKELVAKCPWLKRR